MEDAIDAAKFGPSRMREMFRVLWRLQALRRMNEELMLRYAPESKEERRQAILKAIRDREATATSSAAAATSSGSADATAASS